MKKPMLPDSLDKSEKRDEEVRLEQTYSSGIEGSLAPPEAQTGNAAPGLGYILLTWYVRFFHNHIYYRNVEVIGGDNVPQDSPLMVVCDHQNSLFDPIGLLVSLVNARPSRKVRVITRGNIFSNPDAERALRWIGLMPVYRLAMDGEQALDGNGATFMEAEDELLNDGTIIIFPEANEEAVRRLRPFSQGYLHILFEAAERSGFTKEMFVLPSCNHYSDYGSLQGDLVIKYGTPISLAPYYELYKTKPRTAKRQVNALVREQMSGMMLDISDQKNYEAIDYIRETYGVQYARENGLSPFILKEKLESDRKLCTALENAKTRDEAEVQASYDKASCLKRQRERLGLGTKGRDRASSVFVTIAKGLLLLLGLPLFIVGVLPSLLVITIPKAIASKVPDVKLRKPVNVIINMLAVIPLSALIIFITTYILRGSFILALLCVGIAVLMGLVSYNYYKLYKGWKMECRVLRLKGTPEMEALASGTRELYASLNDILGCNIS